MLNYLEGEILKKGDRFVVVKAGQLGYRVFMGLNSLSKLQEKPASVKIFTHLYLREDSQELYGFLNFEELQFFEMLISVSGVGPKSALLLIDEVPLDLLAGAVGRGEETVLQRVSGIGRKIAQKIIIELRPKVELMALASRINLDSLTDESDALEALKSLGYSLTQAREALHRVSPEIKGVARRVEQALKLLAH